MILFEVLNIYELEDRLIQHLRPKMIDVEAKIKMFEAEIIILEASMNLKYHLTNLSTCI